MPRQHTSQVRTPMGNRMVVLGLSSRKLTELVNDELKKEGKYIKQHVIYKSAVLEYGINPPRSIKLLIAKILEWPVEALFPKEFPHMMEISVRYIPIIIEAKGA